MKTITLPMYLNGKRSRGYADFRVLQTADEVQAHCDARRRVWVRSINGDAREVTINGKVRRWKRDLERIEVPVKYGLYEYATMDAQDVAEGRFLVEA